MKTPAALVILGVLLFIFDMNMPLRIGRILKDIPWYLCLVCLAAGTLLGLIRGPNAVRLTVVLWTISIALYVVAMTLGPRLGAVPVYKPLINFPAMNPAVAIVATVFLVLAVIQGIRAYRAQAAIQSPTP